MTKPKPRKDKETYPAPTLSALERTRATVAKGCQALDQCIDRVTEMLTAEEYDRKLGSHLAWMTKQVAGVTDALRKLEAHDSKTVATMSPEKRDELVMAYLDALTPERMSAVIARLQSRLTRGSVLA